MLSKLEALRFRYIKHNKQDNLYKLSLLSRLISEINDNHVYSELCDVEIFARNILWYIVLEDQYQKLTKI